MGRYSKAFSIKKQFQSPNCQRCQGQSRTMKKIIFLELFLRIIEDEKWNLFEKLGQLRTPSAHVPIWLVLDLVDERGPLEAGERAGDGLLHPVDVLLSVHL